MIFLVFRQIDIKFHNIENLNNSNFNALMSGNNRKTIENGCFSKKIK